MDVMSLRRRLLMQMMGGMDMAKSKSGTFTGNGTKTVDLLIEFEPDAIVIDSGLSMKVAGPVGLYMVAIAKNVFTLNASHNSVTDANASRTIYGQLNGIGWGNNTLGAYRNTAAYANGVLTVSNVTNSPQDQYCFIEGQSYTWTAYKA